jgi:outer membrane protein
MNHWLMDNQRREALCPQISGVAHIHSGKVFSMRIVCRSFIAMIALASAMSALAWAGEVKIAAVDRAKVLKESQAGKKATATLQDFVKARKNIVDMEEADLVKMSEDYNKQAAVLSSEARKEKEENFSKKRVGLQRKAGELEREVQVKQRELAEIYNKQFEEVVKAIAEKEKFVLVVDSSLSLYNNSAIDITDRVTKEMDKVIK